MTAREVMETIWSKHPLAFPLHRVEWRWAGDKERLRPVRGSRIAPINDRPRHRRRIQRHQRQQ